MPTERDALLRAVLEDPDDDLPRRVFADHLLDYGDEWEQEQGRFIHAQLANPEARIRMPLWSFRNPISTAHTPDERVAARMGAGLLAFSYDANSQMHWHRGFLRAIVSSDLGGLIRSADYVCRLQPVVAMVPHLPEGTNAVWASTSNFVGVWRNPTGDRIGHRVGIPIYLLQFADGCDHDPEATDHTIAFESTDEVAQWLSDTLVRYGRHHAGLPPIIPDAIVRV